MQSTLQISRRVDYALRAAICMAELPSDRVLSFREIAARERIPEDFLAKILRSLVERGLVRSVRGPRGGYGLAKHPAEISFLDVIEAADGPIRLNHCLEDSTGERVACEAMDICSMHGVWHRAQDAMLHVFRDATLESVIRPERVCENLIRMDTRRTTRATADTPSSSSP